MLQEQFFSRYTFNVSHDCIGNGTFGMMCKAKDNVLHRTVAIKVSEVKFDPEGNKLYSFRDETEALSCLPNHRNVANYEEFYTFEMPNGIFDYAVMPYFPDGNLGGAIKLGLSEDQMEDVARQLLEGIAFLHENNVMVRSLKPNNILIVREGLKIIPLITDFGMSKTPYGDIMHWYSSPEQLQGKPISSNADLWSYGAILYELFTGELLFGPNNGSSDGVSDFVVFNNILHSEPDLSKMPERWRKVAERCVVYDPVLRAQSAQELLTLIESEGDITFFRPKPVPEPTPTPAPTPVPSYIPASQPSYQPDPQPVFQQPSQLTPEPDPQKVDTGSKPSSRSGKGRKALWIAISVVFAALSGVLLYMLLDDPDTRAHDVCETVNDHRGYMREFGKKGQHYGESKKIVDDFVSDSAAKAIQQAQKIEDEVYAKCVTIPDFDNYLQAYPDGRYVDSVKFKKAALMSVDDEELAFKNCTTIAACNKYLKDYKKGRYVKEVRKIKEELVERQREVAAKKGFSVSSTHRMFLASGNLQYQPSTHKWRIAPNPWDYIGSSNANVASNYSGWIDLFGWGTGNNPTQTSTNNSDYASFNDWGKKMSGGYRSLSDGEWNFVFYKRKTHSDIRFAKATVNGVKGIIVLPDGWSSSFYQLSKTNSDEAGFNSNIISASAWNTKLDPNGAIFLPAAGYREGTSVTDVNSVGYYATSTPSSGGQTYTMFIGSSVFDVDASGTRSRGRSVRLAKAAD